MDVRGGECVDNPLVHQRRETILLIKVAVEIRGRDCHELDPLTISANVVTI